MKRLLILLILSALFFPVAVLAKIGVGVGTGKIQVDETLKPGMSYELPALNVVNTGDEEADFEAAITYHQDQPQLQPAENWFDFKPKSFHLKPNDVQSVTIILNLPIKAKPGDYFAYLEGHPLKKAESGQTSIGVAAAAKLYFTVVPANLSQAVYYKLTAFWINNAPWTSILTVIIIAYLLTKIFKKHFNLQININKKKALEKKDDLKENNDENE